MIEKHTYPDGRPIECPCEQRCRIVGVRNENGVTTYAFACGYAFEVRASDGMCRLVAIPIGA